MTRRCRNTQKKKPLTLDRMNWRQLFIEYVRIAPSYDCQSCQKTVQPEVVGNRTDVYLRCPNCRNIICRVSPMILKIIKEKIRAVKRRQFEENLKNR